LCFVQDEELDAETDDEDSIKHMKAEQNMQRKFQVGLFFSTFIKLFFDRLLRAASKPLICPSSTRIFRSSRRRVKFCHAEAWR